MSTPIAGLLCGCWGSRSSWLHSKHFSAWAISLAPLTLHVKCRFCILKMFTLVSHTLWMQDLKDRAEPLRKEGSCDGQSWFSSWLHLESTNLSSHTDLFSIFLTGSFEARKVTLDLGTSYTPTYKDMEGGSLYLLAACPLSGWQTHPFCCCPITSLASLEVHHRLKSTETPSCLDSTTARFLAFPLGDSHSDSLTHNMSVAQ